MLGQIFGELAILDPNQLSPNAAVAFTAVELYVSISVLMYIYVCTICIYIYTCIQYITYAILIYIPLIYSLYTIGYTSLLYTILYYIQAFDSEIFSFLNIRMMSEVMTLLSEVMNLHNPPAEKLHYYYKQRLKWELKKVKILEGIQHEYGHRA